MDGLVDRDVQICLDLWDYRVLTTPQIAEYRFSSERRARRRLLLLEQRGVIGSFRPPKRPGSSPSHWVLDELGARIVAGYRGVEFKELKYRRDRVFGLAKNQRLQHILEVNGFFTRLAWRCRQAGDDYALEVWGGEEEAFRQTYQTAEPDGYGVVVGPHGNSSFFFELDRGTEDLDRLSDKLLHYKIPCGYRERHDLPVAILFCLHSERREANAQKVLHHVGMTPVATTTLARHMADPLGANWLPIADRTRYPFIELRMRWDAKP